MRVKKILSLIAFIAAFTFSTALSFDENTAQNISLFLQQDISNGQDRNLEASRFDGDLSLSSTFLARRARAVSEYSEASGSMDAGNLPKDFQLAWLKHMRAWHNYADFLEKAKTQRMNPGEMYQLERQYNREINLTWYEVLRVGGEYGATVEEY